MLKYLLFTLASEENNKKNNWNRILNCGVTIIQTDQAKLLIEYLHQKKLHQ